jgi:hypothetical protein
MSFLFAIQAAGARATERTAIEGGRQSLLGRDASHAHEGRRTHLQGFADLCIGPAWPLLARVCFEQDAGMQELAGGLCAGGDQMLQLLALCWG